MKNLIIVGARGFGREAYNAFSSFYKDDPTCTCKGFLDDKQDALDGYKGYPPIIGSPQDYVVQPDDVFFIAMGDVKWRKFYADLIKGKGGSFMSIICPDSFISRNSTVGEGCYINRFVTISCDIQIGDFSFIFSHAALGHDAKVGNFCHMGSFSFLGGYSQLEDGVTLHPGAKVLPHKIVGAGSVVGAGSTVIRNVKENVTVMGIPAKIIEF